MSNRLANEDSPYLQQHKDNPVDWYPWCDEAFEAAFRENKAIFISIGYSSCHWCHVMEENVFTNQECADILNKNFISIKVDREERPDIDKYYQEVYMMLNRRSGGWPTSIFCTPDNKPIFAGTYIPPYSNEGSIQGMGFVELSSLIASKISAYDEDLLKSANEIEKFLNKQEHPKEATILKEDIVKNFLHQAKNNYDTHFGGFSVAPKFPQANTINALLFIDRLYGDKSAKAMVLNTLTNMAKGGMYDLVEGGFCRYSVDEKYLVPHFEKMLYDNALLCELYTNAYTTYKDENFLKIAKECADFWHNCASEDYLMFSALDADTDGEEGEYYIYSYEELVEIFNKDELSELNVSKNGNFEGKNIIRSEYAHKHKDRLKSLRDKKTYPFIDKKVQTSWSSMMIKAMFILGRVDETYTKRAKEYLNKLLYTLFIDSKLYHTTLFGKEPKIEAFLEDYAFLATALIEAYSSTLDEFYLVKAQQITNKALELYYDKGVWRFSTNYDSKADLADNTYTSPISTMVDALLTLALLLDDDKYKHFAHKTLEYNSYDLARRPIYYPNMLLQALKYIKGHRVIKAKDAKNVDLNSFDYPFVLKKLSEDEGFMVCGEKSCFNATKNIYELNDILNGSL